MGIIRFSSDAEAVRLTNQLEYGLSGAVHSRDLARATRMARQLEINLIHINSFTLHDNAVRLPASFSVFFSLVCTGSGIVAYGLS